MGPAGPGLGEYRPMKPSLAFLLSLTLPLLLAACGDSTSLGDGDEAGVPPLVAMAESGDLAGLERLLRKDPKPDVRDSCDWTPLMKAALNGHLEAVERLLAAGATVDSEDKGGYTALMLAASNNHAAVVEQLLAHRAMVDHQERTQGWTALIWAIKQGHRQTVQTLMRHRADPTLEDRTGRTAADWAREAGHPDLLPLIETPRTH